jgi:kynurenine 3-monooxygenase
VKEQPTQNFCCKKKIESRLHEKYPDKWIPAYSQVTFSPQIRYSDALRRGQKQEEIMKKIMQMPGIESNWENEELLSGIIKVAETKN